MESEKRRLKIIWQELGENELSLLFVETASIKIGEIDVKIKH